MPILVLFSTLLLAGVSDIRAVLDQQVAGYYEPATRTLRLVDRRGQRRHAVSQGVAIGISALQRHRHILARQAGLGEVLRLARYPALIAKVDFISTGTAIQ